MKLKITLFLLLASHTIFAQIDYITFLDPNFKTAVLANGVDTNGDGEIQFAEANDYTGTLDVSNSGITDAIEIAYFRNITTINFDNNSLWRLNVRGCTNLETINARNNEIDDIDTEGLTTLKYLNIQNNNLTSIDVSTNTALLYLVVFDNQLKKLDILNNPLCI